MRIVGGKHRSRRLIAPEGLAVRPTSDRARQAIFNILEHGDFGAGGASPLIGARVLDGFAGSGALGFEALSRGAVHLTCMDRDRQACAAIKANAAALGETGRTIVLAADATNPPAAANPCNFVFLDPPYDSGDGARALAALAARGWIAPGAICTVEIAADEAFDPPSGFTRFDERRYGLARILFLRREPA